jgi:hypothetical protein
MKPSRNCQGGTRRGLANKIFREDRVGSPNATDPSWFILAFYVPFLWVTAVLLIWQLVARRRKPLGSNPS